MEYIFESDHLFSFFYSSQSKNDESKIDAFFSLFRFLLFITFSLEKNAAWRKILTEAIVEQHWNRYADFHFQCTTT